MVLGAITALFVLLAPVIMPLFAPGFEGRDPRPHRHPLPGPLPDPDPARGQRHRRRHPQQLRPLRRLRDLAAVLEPDDHPRPRRPRAAVPRPGPDLRLRDRDPRRHPGAAADPGLGPAPHAVPASASASTGATRGVRRVLLLMLPVTISLGLINFNLLINSFFGSLVSDQAPAAIDKAFRIYQLPQGIFSVAIATVLFPTLARFANARGDRQPAGDDGERDAPDPLRPGAGGGGDPRPLRTDDPARLPARRIRPGADDAGRDGPLLVRLLAADQRPLPAADPDLLQPAAALAGDRRWRRSTSSSRRWRRWRSTSPSGSAASSPGPGSGRPPRSSPRR